MKHDQDLLINLCLPGLIEPSCFSIPESDQDLLINFTNRFDSFTAAFFDMHTYNQDLLVISGKPWFIVLIAVASL